MIGSIELIQDTEKEKYGYKISWFNSEGARRISFFRVPKKDFYLLKYDQELSDEFGIGTEDEIHPDEYADFGIIGKSWDNKYVKKGYPHRDNIKHCQFGMLDFLATLPEDKLKQMTNVRNKPAFYACDIETATDPSTGEFSDAHVAGGRITSFAFADPQCRSYAVGDKPLSREQIRRIERKVNEHFHVKKEYKNVNFTLKYKYFEKETEMIEHIAEDVWSKLPLVSGWNFLDYDWNYIYHRCLRLGINPSKFSPEGRMSKKKGKVRDFSGNKVISEYELPIHVQIHDYGEIFKRFDRKIKVKENNKLDWVSEQVLGVKKIQYDGDLMQLYENDFEKYMFYNVVDTLLVQLIHKKIATLDTQVSNMGALQVPLDDLYGTIRPTEKLMHQYFTENGGLLIPKDYSKPFAPDEEEAKMISINYKGGQVFQPQGGRYYPEIVRSIANAVILSKDFAGLYPSILESFNFSPSGFIETFCDMKLIKEDRLKVLGCPKLVKENEAWNEQIYANARKEAYKKYGNNPDYMISIRGAVYCNKYDREYRVIQRTLSKSRDAHKALKFYYEGLLDTLKNEKKRRLTT